MKTPSLVVLKLPSLAKSPTIGNVNFHSEGQYAFLGKVAFHGNVVVLGKIVFLGKVADVVIDSIVLVLLLVALASLPLLHPHCRQHRELVSAQSQSSCNMRWRHRQHRAVDVAGVVLASSPLLCGCLCPCCAGIATLAYPRCHQHHKLASAQS